ncbi:hypothetical protein [Burkholderia seminalis]|uniref:hypothetical protein n=1 Tax=Burkholderia seminalis TaxID=488731 RepID=UPI00299D6051|nr:hypothetical protein [Burkholderia seminalis]
MKRLAVTLGGFIWGLLVTWASLYTFSRIHWPTTPSHSTGCNDMEHCAPQAVFVVGLLALTLWPSVLFAVINAFAYRRWSSRRWGNVFVMATLFVVVFHLASYAAPALGLFSQAGSPERRNAVCAPPRSVKRQPDTSVRVTISSATA